MTTVTVDHERARHDAIVQRRLAIAMERDAGALPIVVVQQPQQPPPQPPTDDKPVVWHRAYRCACVGGGLRYRLAGCHADGPHRAGFLRWHHADPAYRVRRDDCSPVDWRQ